MSRKRKLVLFLCTGNSCRSQMAEAIVNREMGEEWEALSAGTRPEGFVSPYALEALLEIGIDHTGTSKGLEAMQGQALDLIVTVCDSAAEECPLWVEEGNSIHLGFEDPAKARGTEEEKMADYRAVLEKIRVDIPKLLKAQK